MLSNRSLLLMLLLFALLIILPISRVSAAVLLKPSDRVVIYGDSITEQRLYSRFFQQYLACRYPELHLAFYNAGWSGDTAEGALNRLERDVLPLHPTVVTLFFGMNDGQYRAVDDGVVKNYRHNMEELIKVLLAKKIRVIIFTPGCVDPDKNAQLGTAKYNTTLETLGKAASDLARQYNCPVVDVLHPMLAFQTSQKSANSAFTISYDGVHPNPDGHLVMTCTMLQGIGAEPMPALGSFDLATYKGTNLRLLSNTNGEICLETTEPAFTPFWFDPSSLPVMRTCGFLDMAGQKLTVRSLTAAAYDLEVNGIQIGRYSSKEFAFGVLIPGAYSQRGKLVHDMIARKENNYYTLWRETRLVLADAPFIDKASDYLMVVDDTLTSSVQQLCTPTDPAEITLISAPEGKNLALGKSYVCSDTNHYGWGKTSLTDGSWEENVDHCFATGDSPTFPKTVTIDLGQMMKINRVIAGVPAFGSTKTIAVSVSADGQQFTDIGSHLFPLRHSERYNYQFSTLNARYVRLTYPDFYQETVGYSNVFSFTSEVEVYGPAQ